MITRENTVETLAYKLVTEASTIGLGVSDWPDKLETDLGNGLPFKFFEAKRERGELVVAIYKQMWGTLVLHVLND